MTQCLFPVGAGLARSVFERAVEFFGEEHMDESLLIAFAAFEEQCKEVRACGITRVYLKLAFSCLFSTPNSMSERG